MLLLPALLIGVIALSYYVHKRCFEALGADPIDNNVMLQKPEDAAVPTSPNGNGSSSSSSGDTASSISPVSPPVLVVVLGWGGSTRKQLRRVIDFIVQTLKCPVVSYINPMIQFLYGTLDTASIESILSHIDHEVCQKKNVSGFVFLVHSNNGAFVYSECKTQIQDKKSKYHHLLPHLKGVIFDSAPAIHISGDPTAGRTIIRTLIDPFIAAFGFSFPSVAIVTKRPQYIHPFWTPAITLWTICFRGTYTIMNTLSGNKSIQMKASDSRQILQKLLVKENVLEVPHLFLYSSGDKLLNEKYIDSYIAFLRSILPASLIQVHNFRTTGHVQHFLKQSQKYGEELKQFLELSSGGK